MSCKKKCHVCNGKSRDEEKKPCYWCKGTGKLDDCDMQYVYRGIVLWGKHPYESMYKCTKCGKVEWRTAD